MGERGVRTLKDVSPGAQAARRFVPTGMKDVRWVVGIVLLALGVLGTLRVIGSFDDSVQVWSAKSALVPGQRLTSSDLVPTSVRLDDRGGQYLSSATQPGADATVSGDVVPLTDDQLAERSADVVSRSADRRRAADPDAPGGAATARRRTSSPPPTAQSGPAPSAAASAPRAPRVIARRITRSCGC